MKQSLIKKYKLKKIGGGYEFFYRTKYYTRMNKWLLSVSSNKDIEYRLESFLRAVRTALVEDFDYWLKNYLKLKGEDINKTKKKLKTKCLRKKI